MKGLASMAFACLLVGGCFSEAAGDGTGSATASVPIRGEWRVALDASMPIEGPGAIERIRVGGREYEDNFANRGDIVVDTWDEPRIRVQMRAFTRSVDTLIAQEELDKFELWAFATEGQAPQRPDDMVVPRPCVLDNGSLREGCAIRVLYDGLLQPARAGVDLWITVPERWGGFLELYTEDNDHDGDYLNRGNVCVEGVSATVYAEFESGVGLARLSEGARLDLVGDAANLTVDVPDNVTSRLSSTVTPRRASDLLCSAKFEVTDVVFDDSQGSQADTQTGSAGVRPHTELPAIFATANARDCVDQVNAESPAEYLGPDDVGESVVHGNIRFCHGCLADPCSQLLPGFE